MYSLVVTDSLRTLLQEKHGWDGHNPDLQLQLRNEQIPSELRTQLRLYRRLLQVRTDALYRRTWLSDNAWQKARLVVRQDGKSIVDGQLQPRFWKLFVSIPFDGKELTHSVAKLVDEGDVE